MESRLYVEYAYDLNGNTTSRTIYKNNDEIEVIEFDYDGMNRLVQTVKSVYPGDIEAEPKTTESTVYFYDNAGNRFIKQDSEGTTLYLRHGQIAVAMDIELPVDVSEEKAVTNRYILSGDLLAGRVTSTIKADDSVESDTFYYHLDHLNSTKAVTNENGEIVVLYEYRAFGEQLKRLNASGDDTGDEAKYSYGGKELDEGSNLYYFNARYYDATIGRFINVDPVQDGSNWYVYCSNNPLLKTDPTGLTENYSDSINLKTLCDNLHSEYKSLSFNGIHRFEMNSTQISAMQRDHNKGIVDWFDKAIKSNAVDTTINFFLNFVKIDKGILSPAHTIFIGVNNHNSLTEKKNQADLIDKLFPLIDTSDQSYKNRIENMKVKVSDHYSFKFQWGYPGNSLEIKHDVTCALHICALHI